MKKYITFITTIYNSNRYLDDFFSSFSELDKNSFEIVAVDDCGNEDASKLIMKWKKTFPIKYIKNKKNMGISYSRNKGLEQISKQSTHIIYVDSDDVIISDNLFKNIHLNKITYFNEFIWTKTRLIYNDMNKHFGTNGFHGGMACRAFPVEVAKEFKHDESVKYYEDMLISRRIEKKYGTNIILSEVALAKYRQRKSSITNTVMSLEKFSDMHDQWEKMIAEDLIGYVYAKYELRQRYWIWHKGLKGFDLAKTKWWIKIIAFLGGNIVRFLGLKKIIYNKKMKNLFE